MRGPATELRHGSARDVTNPLLPLVVTTLNRLGASHALIGAAALAAHGVARSTYDTDLLTTDARVLEPAAWAGLAAEAQCDIDVRRGDADDPLAGVVRISRGHERDVDVIVGRSAWQRDAIERAGEVDLGSLRLRVVTAADLVLLKLYAGGAQDQWDVEQLVAVGARDAIVSEVESRLDLLPLEVRDTWNRLRSR